MQRTNISQAEGDLDLTRPHFDDVTNNGDGRVSNVKWTIEMP